MHESKISNRSVLTVTAIGLVASISFPHGAQAQSKQDAVGGILGLIGNISQGAAKSKAQKGWAQTGEPVRACINTMFSEKNLSVEQLAAAGVGPTDPRIAQLVTSCNQIMSAQLQTNISCNVTNSKGHQVQSLCNQVFAKEENGKISEVSREDFLRAAARGEKVQVALLETSVANSARLNEERRLAEVERQAFLASPEGKRQAAADAARARKAAADQAARQKAAEVTRHGRAKCLRHAWPSIGHSNRFAFVYHRINIA